MGKQRIEDYLGGSSDSQKPLKDLNPYGTKEFRDSQGKESFSRTIKNSLKAKDYIDYVPNLNLEKTEGLDEERANNQSAAEQIGNSLVQFGAGFLGGAAMAAGTSLDMEQSVKTVMGTEKEYNNLLFDFGKNIMAAASESNPIYEVKPGKVNPADAGWWATQFGQIGLSAGIMAESAVETAAISYLTEGTGLGASLAGAAKKLRNIKGIKDLMGVANTSSRLKTMATTFGIINRHHEAIMEAADSFQSHKEELMKRGDISEEQATDIAAKAAQTTYLGNLPLMALDILQFRAMTFNPMSGTSSGGIVEGLLSKIGSPKLAKAIGMGAGIASESGEEFWQYLVQEESKHYADDVAGIGNDSTFAQRFKGYSDKGEMWNATIGGAFGGVVLGGISKGLSMFSAKRAEKQLESEHQNFIKGMTGIGVELSNQIRVAEADGDEMKANNIRRSMGVQKAMHAVHLDALKDSDAAFISYIDGLQSTLDAANSANPEQIKAMGIEGSEEFIKQSVPAYLQDAKKVKEIYDEVKQNNAKDAVIPITYRRFLVDRLNEEIINNTANIAATEASLPDLSNVSGMGRIIYDSTVQMGLYQSVVDDAEKTLKNPKLSEVKRIAQENRKIKAQIEVDYHKLQIENQKLLNSDPKTTMNDADILEGVKGNVKLSKLYSDKVALEDYLNQTRKELNTWSDPKFQAKSKLGQLTQVIANATSVTELNKAEDTLNKQGILTSEFKQAIAEKRTKLQAKEEAAALRNNPTPAPVVNPVVVAPSTPIEALVNGTPPAPTGRPVNPVMNPADFSDFGMPVDTSQAEIQVITPLRSAAAGAMFTAANTPANATIVNEETLFEPAPISDNLTDEQKQTVKEKLSDYYTSLQAELGRKPTARELVEDMIAHTSAEQVERNFKVIELGWNLNEYPKTNFNQLYNDFFGDRKSKANDFFQYATEVTQTEEEFKQEQQELDEQFEDSQTPPVSTEETPTGEVIFHHVKPFKTVQSTLKMAHLSVAHIRTMEQGEEGITNIDYIQTSEELNDGQYVDSKELMDYDKYQPGTEMQAKVPDNSGDILIAQWKDNWEKGKAVPFNTWAEGKDPNSDEYIGRMPMIIYNSEGKGVAFVHDIEWYNPSNLGLEMKPNEQARVIAEARKELLELRKAILANNGTLKLTVTKKTPGTKFTIPDDKPKITVNQANPQALVGFANDFDNMETNGGIINSDQILNANFMERGHKYDLRQVGITENGKPQYYASPVFYEKLDTEVQTSIGVALKIYLAKFDPNGDIANKESVKKVVAEVEAATGLVLTDQADFETYLQTFIQTYVGRAKIDTDIVQEMEKDDKVKVGTPYIAIAKGKLIFGIKGKMMAGGVRFMFTHPGNMEGGDKVQAKRALGVLQRVMQPDFIGAFTQNIHRKHLQSNSKVVLISNKGEVTEAGTYDNYLKDRLKTNLKSFDIGGGKLATFLQPVINFTYEGQNQTETTEVQPAKSIKQIAQEAAAQTTESVPTLNEEELISSINAKLAQYEALGLSNEALQALRGLTETENKPENPLYDPNYEKITDELVGKVKKKITKIEELDTTDRGVVVQFIANEIMRDIEPQRKNSINKKELITKIGQSFTNLIAPKVDFVNAEITALTQLYNTGKFPNLKSVIDDFGTVIHNADVLKANWNSLVNEAFEKHIARFTGISVTMSKDQKTIDVAINEEPEQQDEIITEEVDNQDEDMPENQFEFEGDEARGKNYSKESMEDNGKNSTSYLIKRFLSQIPEYTSTKAVKTGFMGITTYPGFDHYYNLIGTMLSTPRQVESNIDAIITRLNTHRESQPWVAALIEKLENADQQFKNAFMYNFNRETLSMKFVMYSHNRDNGKDKLKVYDTNASAILRVIQNKWKENFKQSNLVISSTGEINKEKAAQLLEVFNKWTADKTKKSLPTPIEAKAWLAEFGIELSSDTITDIHKNGIWATQDKKPVIMKYDNMFANSNNTNGIFGKLANYLQSMVLASADKLDYQENDIINPFADANGILSKIASVQAKYTLNITTNSFRDNGKAIFGYTPSKYATSMLNMMWSNPKILENKKKISFDQNAYLIDLFENDENFKEKFSIDHIGITAFKELGKTVSSKSEVTDLAETDLELMRLGLFQDGQQGEVKSKTFNGIALRVGRMFFPTMADKKTMLSLTTAVMDLKVKDFTFNEDGSIALSDQLKEFLFNQLIDPEFKRILNHHAKAKELNIHPNELVNQKGYNLAAQIFSLIPEMNNLMYSLEDGTQVRLIEFLANSAGMLDEAGQQSVRNKIMGASGDLLNKLFTELAAAKVDSWGTNGYLIKGENDVIAGITKLDSDYITKRGGTVSQNVQVAAMDYILNTAVTTANVHMLIAGDVANFSQDKAFKKSIIDGKPYMPVNNEVYANMMEQVISINLGKRLAMLIAPGATLADSKNDKYIQLFLKDRVSVSENINYLIELYHGKQKLQDNLEDINAAKVGDEQAISRLAKAFPDLGAYFEIESTDAQEYTTAKEHLDILYRQGRVNPEQYKEFSDKIRTQRDAEAKGEAIPESALLTDAELKIVFQPIKPVYSGQINDVKNNVSRMVYIKSSSFPLIPQVTQAFNGLNQLRKNMEQLEDLSGRNVRASYDTANKVGSVLPQNQIEVWDAEGNFIEGSIDATKIHDQLNKGEDGSALVLDREFFRIQQDVPFKSAKAKMDMVTLGTQMMKLMFGNGVNQIGENIFEVSGKKMNGQQLQDYYTEMFKSWLANEKSGLYDTLGIDESTGQPLDKVKTMQKLQNLLQLEAKKRNYPLQDIEALELDMDSQSDNPQFLIPLWLSPNSNRYEALLNSIVSNRLLNLKLPGAAFVAGSEEGFKSSGSNKNKVILTLGTSGSGKSTWIKSLPKNAYTVISVDDMRIEFTGTIDDKSKDKEIYEEVKNRAINAVNNGKQVIIDSTNLQKDRRRDFLAAVKQAIPDVSLEYKLLPLNSKLAKERIKNDIDKNVNRANVSDSTIDRHETLYKDMLNDIKEEGIKEFNEGFRTSEDVNGLDQSNIIFTSNWTGELRGTRHEDGSIKTAQVLVPSKLRGRDGKLLDLFAKNDAQEYLYITQQENGTFKLKEDMIDMDLLSMSSFRIPTSSHVSMSQIEVVGILPPEMGDLIIVPKNFTKQKGLDFDVDKENVYMLHHIVDENGRIVKLEENTYGVTVDNIDEEIASYEGFLQELQDKDAQTKAAIQNYKDELDLYETYPVLGDADKKTVRKLISELKKDLNSADIKSMVTALKDLKALKTKLHQNEIIKVYSAILGNADQRVQSKINKVLSTDFAEEQADLISGLSSEGRDNSQFTILSDVYQKEKMEMGAAGKLGISVYSNAVVLHSLIQQSSKPIQLLKKDALGELSPYKLAIGNILSDGKLGRQEAWGAKLTTGDRSITEILAERQNTGTDNEKLQIMGRVNVNEITINVDTLMSLLGFDKVDVDGQQYSLPYLLLSQPVLKEFVTAIRNTKSNLAEYNANAEADVVAKLKEKYAPTDKAVIYSSGNLTGDVLVKGIEEAGKDGAAQIAALETFLELKRYGEAITQLQGRLNIQRGGLGKSMFEMIDKYESVRELSENESISNVPALVGDYVFAPSRLEDRAKMISEGYIFFDDNNTNIVQKPFAVKPTTVTGALLINAAKTGYQLWADHFPHQHPTINRAVNQVVDLMTTSDSSTAKKLKLKHEIFGEMKKYLYSSQQLGIFEDNPQVERARLFMDTENNQSLISYLKDFMKSDHVNKNTVANNKLISSFQYTLENGELPSVIKYNNSQSEDFNEEYKYQALVELMDKNVPLADYNGKPYTSRMLAKDLISYAYLEGGMQEAIQFVKYVPVAYLKEIGFAEKAQIWQRAARGEKFYNAAHEEIDLWEKMLGAERLGILSRFGRQYAQHNAQKMPKVTEAGITPANADYKGTLDSIQSFTVNDESPEEATEFKAIYNKNIKKGKVKFQLYQYDGQVYHRIPTLGVFGMSEYSLRDDNVKPLVDVPFVPKNKGTNTKGENKSVANTPFKLSEGSLTATLNEVIDAKIAGVSDMAKTLLPSLKNNVVIKVGVVNNGRSRGSYLNNVITIDSSYLANPNTTKEMLATTILHEYVHSLTEERLSDYFKKDGTPNVSFDKMPSDVQRLHRLLQEVEKTMAPEIAEFKEWYSKNTGKLRDEDDRILYAGMNIFEFSAMIMSEPAIQKKMAGIKYMATERTLLEQFAMALDKILSAIGVKFDANSVTAQGMASVFKIIENSTPKIENKPTDFGNFIQSSADESLKDLLDKNDLDENQEDLLEPGVELNQDCIF